MTPEFRQKLIRQGHFWGEVCAQIGGAVLSAGLIHAGSHGFAALTLGVQLLQLLNYSKGVKWQGPRDKWPAHQREQMRLAEAIYLASQIAFEDLKTLPPPARGQDER